MEYYFNLKNGLLETRTWNQSDGVDNFLVERRKTPPNRACIFHGTWLSLCIHLQSSSNILASYWILYRILFITASKTDSISKCRLNIHLLKPRSKLAGSCGIELELAVEGRKERRKQLSNAKVQRRCGKLPLSRLAYKREKESGLIHHIAQGQVIG